MRDDFHAANFIKLAFVYISSAESATMISPKVAILSFLHQLTQYWLIAMMGWGSGEGEDHPCRWRCNITVILE